MDVMTEENVDLDRKKTEIEKLNQIGAEGATLNYLINKIPYWLFFENLLNCSNEVMLINVQGGVNVYIETNQNKLHVISL